MNPLSIFIYYSRNKRKALPVLGILTLAVFGISLTLVLTATIFDGVRGFVSPYYHFVVVEPNYNKKYYQLDTSLRADVRQSEHLAVYAPIQTSFVYGTVLGIPTNYAIFGVSDDLMPRLLQATETNLLEGRLPGVRENEVALHESLMKTRGLQVGDYIGREINREDNLDGKWRVVGVIGGKTILNLVALDRITHGRTPNEIVLIPKTGEMEGLALDLNALKSERATIQTPAYWNQFIEKTLSQYDSLVTALNVVIITVLSLGVGLLNMIYFRQRTGEFGILSGIGFSRSFLVRRVTLEALVLTIVAWLLGMALSVAVYQILDTLVFAPQGTHLSILNTRLLLGTLPVPIFVWLFSTVTIMWQLTRLDPVAVIDRRD
ncbi:MAG: ABC transporter permease [Chloroflexota bacterium]|nr:MAG: ABC transporter permease [Chloroflexota bacterium]